MLKSLYSGVSGLQSHQIAMDVESNNVANVNTVGFKYSRANFADLLSQTNQIATAPQGNSGGQNGVQVGLGATIKSITRIHSQGSIQNTDKNTDVAIQGDGFFILSSDGGKTLNYSRSGDFKFDASGNFVDNNGYVVQGWLRNDTTGKVDSAGPIEPILIEPGLTTPAKATTGISLKANLNSGDTVQSFSSIRSLDSFHLAYDINGDGVLNAQDSLDGDLTYENDTGGYTALGGLNADDDLYNENTNNLDRYFVDANGNVVERGEDFGVLVNSSGEAFQLQSGSVADQGQGAWIGFRTAVIDPAGGPVTIGALAAGAITVNGVSVPSVSAGATATEQANLLASAINAINNKTGVTASVVNGDEIRLTNDNSGSVKNITVGGASAGNLNLAAAADQPMVKFRYTDGGTNTVGWNAANDTYYFTTTEDMREGMQQLARDPDRDGIINAGDSNVTVEVDSVGRFVVTNPGGGALEYTLDVTISALTDSVTSANSRFTQSLQALSGRLSAGGVGTLQTQDIHVPTHSSSIDVFDSLGSKHTVRIDFRKQQFDPTTGSTWSMVVTVPEPGIINTAIGSTPLAGQWSNVIEGKVTFDSEGALSTFTPPSISYTANNGSAPNQTIKLDLGTSASYDGMTSFDSDSTTSGISQDGYTGGDLVGIRIDQSGTLVGSFSNGRSFGLAQISMAKFANNEGLATDGSNLYSQSANSGDPIIGTADTGGRGFIQSSSLEASNVDLSKSLTNLIIIQRGYQANGKTITTSDTLLETLIGLKR